MSEETGEAFVLAKDEVRNAADTLKEACEADGENFREVMEEITNEVES